MCSCEIGDEVQTRDLATYRVIEKKFHPNGVVEIFGTSIHGQRSARIHPVKVVKRAKASCERTSQR